MPVLPGILLLLLFACCPIAAVIIVSILFISIVVISLVINCKEKVYED